MIGTVNFEAGETFKTINVPLTDDAYVEGNETFTISLSNSAGASLGSPSISTITITDNEVANGTNPIDNAQFFVRQHYLDFLNRDPDPSGFAFWTNEITSCGTNQQCVEIKRINVSAAFFLSIEFQESSNFVYRLYKGTLGRRPTYTEFNSDRSKIVIGQNFSTNKLPLLLNFIERPEFTNKYPASSGGLAFIDPLLQTVRDGSGVDLTGSRMQYLAAWDNCVQLAIPQICKSITIERVVNEAAFRQAVLSESFVLMEYFGYLRRNPNDLPDTDFSGYNFWLNKLNQFNGNFVNAEMVKAFIVSDEYRRRFGP
jgi:hypothetical protein